MWHGWLHQRLCWKKVVSHQNTNEGRSNNTTHGNIGRQLVYLPFMRSGVTWDIIYKKVQYMVNDLDNMIMLILVDYGMDTHKNLHLVALVSIRLTKTLEKIPFTKTHSSIKPMTMIICYKDDGARSIRGTSRFSPRESEPAKASPERWKPRANKARGLLPRIDVPQTKEGRRYSNPKQYRPHRSPMTPLRPRGLPSRAKALSHRLLWVWEIGHLMRLTSSHLT